MPVLSDFACKFCGAEYEAWTNESSCRRCGGTGDRRYTQLITTEWGRPKFIRSLQKTFDSRSDLNKWLKNHNMTQSPTADKRGGAHLGDTEAPRVERIYHDPRALSSRSKGTHKRVDTERKD